MQFNQCRSNDIFAAKAAHAIAEVAEDIYNKRHVFRLQADEQLMLSYRVSIDFKEPSGEFTDEREELPNEADFFVHLSIRGSYIVYNISDDSQLHHRFDYLEGGLCEDADYLVAAKSYRRYIFADCLDPAIERKILRLATDKTINYVHIWDTFPCEIKSYTPPQN